MVAREPRVAEQTRRAVEPIQSVPRDAQRRQVGRRAIRAKRRRVSWRAAVSRRKSSRAACAVSTSSAARSRSSGGAATTFARASSSANTAPSTCSLSWSSRIEAGSGQSPEASVFRQRYRSSPRGPLPLDSRWRQPAQRTTPLRQLPRLGTVAGLPVGLRGLPDRLADKGRMGVLVDDRIAPVAVLVNVAGSLAPIDAVGEQTANRRRRPLTLGFGRNLVEPSGDLTSALAPPSPLENLGRDRSLIVGDEATGLAFVVAEKAIRGDMDPAFDRLTLRRCPRLLQRRSQRISAKTKIVCRNAAPAGVA